MRPERPGKIRIIGGEWRGRKLPVAKVDALRPTPDRIRETLFNWLQPVITGARCLDLFAGTGVLGFEALSRGAANTVLVENNRLLVQQLDENIRLLGTDSAHLVSADAMQWLKSTEQVFDIVFLDPPFHTGLVGTACRSLRNKGNLAGESLVYVETEPGLDVPEGFDVSKHGKAGKVQYMLIRMI